MKSMSFMGKKPAGVSGGLGGLGWLTKVIDKKLVAEFLELGESVSGGH
jgi:hypothetical protein